MDQTVSDIARRLADCAEGVCRHYLSNGRREGRYWFAGDVHNAAGRSLYVRLTSSWEGGGPPGKWTDAATGQHGDLFDLIALARGHRSVAETLEEARAFLRMPVPSRRDFSRPPLRHEVRNTSNAAQRLWAAARPAGNTLAERYLLTRGLSGVAPDDPLRFHTRCFYRTTSCDAPGTARAWPAVLAGVTDLQDRIVGVHRTWLDRSGGAKAPLAVPRRAMGNLLGHAVRFGAAGSVMAAGEGLETVLSIRRALPALPTLACLSAAHLAAVAFPAPLRRLYVARDDDAAGAEALRRLRERAAAHGIEVLSLEARLDDLNSDLTAYGSDWLARTLRGQLHPADQKRFGRQV